MAPIFTGLLTLVVGAVLCFGGFRFLRFLLFIVGFAVGFALGGLGLALITGKGFLSDVYGWAAAIVLGLVIAGLAAAFFVAGVAVLGGALGYGIGVGGMTALGYDTTAVFTQAVGIAAAAVLIGLTFVLNVHRALVILYTATAGAAAMVAGALILLGRVALERQQALDAANFVRSQPVWLLPWAVLAIAGLGAQWRSAPRRVATTPAPAVPTTAQPAPAGTGTEAAAAEPLPSSPGQEPAAGEPGQPPGPPPATPAGPTEGPAHVAQQPPGPAAPPGPQPPGPPPTRVEPPPG